MSRIRRLLSVAIMTVTLTGFVSARAMAQPGTGPSGPAPSGGTPASQSNRVVFTADSLPKMLKDLGYTVTEKPAPNGGVYWQIVTQSENWNFTVQVMPLVNQDKKIAAILLSSDLGRKVSPQAGAQDVLKLLQWNQEVGLVVFFGYNAQSGCVTAQRPHIFPDATPEEMRIIFDDFFKTIRGTHAIWNPVGAPAAPAGNGGQAQNGKPAEVAKEKEPANITGSTWTGTESLPGFGKLTFAFRANGAATMIDAKGQTEGTWTQTGNEVTINFNGCVYQGRINGQMLAGSGRITSGGQAGQTWSFQVALQKN